MDQAEVLRLYKEQFDRLVEISERTVREEIETEVEDKIIASLEAKKVTLKALLESNKYDPMIDIWLGKDGIVHCTHCDNTGAACTHIPMLQDRSISAHMLERYLDQYENVCVTDNIQLPFKDSNLSLTVCFDRNTVDDKWILRVNICGYFDEAGYFDVGSAGVGELELMSMNIIDRLTDFGIQCQNKDHFKRSSKKNLTEVMDTLYYINTGECQTCATRLKTGFDDLVPDPGMDFKWDRAKAMSTTPIVLPREMPF